MIMLEILLVLGVLALAILTVGVGVLAAFRETYAGAIETAGGVIFGRRGISPERAPEASRSDLFLEPDISHSENLTEAPGSDTELEAYRYAARRFAELAGVTCPHGNDPAECSACFAESDLAFDAWRETR